jgi:hypothetical protein
MPQLFVLLLNFIMLLYPHKLLCNDFTIQNVSTFWKTYLNEAYAATLRQAIFPLFCGLGTISCDIMLPIDDTDALQKNIY